LGVGLSRTSFQSAGTWLLLQDMATRCSCLSDWQGCTVPGLVGQVSPREPGERLKRLSRELHLGASHLGWGFCCSCLERTPRTGSSCWAGSQGLGYLLLLWKKWPSSKLEPDPCSAGQQPLLSLMESSSLCPFSHKVPAVKTATGSGPTCWETKGLDPRVFTHRHPSPLHCPSKAPSGVLCPVLGSPLQERWKATAESRRGLRGWWGDWSISPARRGWGSWACSAWGREGCEGTL